MNFNAFLLAISLALLSTHTTALMEVHAAPLRSNPFQMNFRYFAKSLLNIFHHDHAIKEPQELLVIGAGFGRTGTSSFFTALNRMGLLSYHFTAALSTPGHLGKWVDYIKGDISVDDVIQMWSVDGFNATASMPACFLYKQLMEQFPKALVVLTVRGDGDGMAWATSILESVALIRQAVSRIPFTWIPQVQHYKILFDWIFAQGNVVALDDNDANIKYNATQLAEMYNMWVAEVQQTVPREKLLVFAAQDGWKPLCDFLSPLSNQVASNCRDIIESGDPYPSVNEKAHVARMVGFLNVISTAFEYGPFALGLIAAVWWIIIKKRRRGVKKKRQNSLS